MRVVNKKAGAFLLIVVAYVISGKASLMLALPPGYASAIFPPAGIAVAAVFIAGMGALPGIFLGSLILNIWVGYSANHQTNSIGFAAASIIAVASMLQAAAGGWVLRRSIGYPNAFDRVGDLFRFLLLAPLICLVSASLSVSGLWSLDIFDTNSLASNWLSWWIGDSLGVMVLLPITMVLIGEPRSLWKGRLKTVALPMLIIFTLFVAMFLKTNKWEQDDTLMEFRQISQQSLNLIQTKLEEQESVLADMRGLFIHEIQGNISRQEFQRYTQDMLVRFPMIQAFEWPPRIDLSRRTRFEALQRKEVPGFEIKEHDTNGQLRRADKRSQFYPVTYVEPLIGNEPALGFDLASTPQRQQALSHSTDYGLVTASAPIRLVQAENQTGMLIMQSVKADGQEIGVVLTVLKMRAFIDKILPPASTLLYVRLIDDDDRSVIYDNLVSTSPEFLFERTFDFGSRHYRLQTIPTAAYFKQHRGWQSWGVLAMGTFGTGLLGALLLLGTGYTARVVAQVEGKTRELKESELRLKELFENLSSGVAVYRVSPDGNDFFISDFNHAAERIDNVRREELIGKNVVESFPDIHEFGLLEALKRVWKTGVAEHFPISIYLDGRIAGWRDNYVYKLLNGEIVAIYDDITKAKQFEEQLHHLAHYDALTGLPNRALFTDRLQQSLVAARRAKTRLAVMFIDLDKFKPVNDTLGHDVGDMLLKEVSMRLSSCVRESDTISRIGGDEFIALLPNIDAAQDAMTVAEKILSSLDQSFEVAGHDIHISSSIGIAVYPEHGDQDKLLVKNADIAMYFAKENGRNQVSLFQHNMLNNGK